MCLDICSCINSEIAGSEIRGAIIITEVPQVLFFFFFFFSQVLS